MRVYVAGKWEEKERVRQVQTLLRKAGHTITFDWTKSAGLGLEKQASRDTVGVLTADAFVGVFEKDLPYRGAYTELGMAIATGIPIYILGHAADLNIFVNLPRVKYGMEDLLNERSEAAVRG